MRSLPGRVKNPSVRMAVLPSSNNRVDTPRKVTRSRASGAAGGSNYSALPRVGGGPVPRGSVTPAGVTAPAGPPLYRLATTGHLHIYRCGSVGSVDLGVRTHVIKRSSRVPACDLFSPLWDGCRSADILHGSDWIWSRHSLDGSRS